MSSGCVTVTSERDSTNPAVTVSIPPNSCPGFPFACSGVHRGRFWCHLVGGFGCGCAALELTPVCFQLDVSTYELERLHTKVTSLCNRIEQLRCHNAKDRLAQSGTVTALCSSSQGQPAPAWLTPGLQLRPKLTGTFRLEKTFQIESNHSPALPGSPLTLVPKCHIHML